VTAAADSLTDQELLREVMNTVGRYGRLGGSIRCVVSVSMLTEGWDANTVTHVHLIGRLDRQLHRYCPSFGGAFRFMLKDVYFRINREPVFRRALRRVGHSCFRIFAGSFD
jgi:hypothetical protein